MAPEAGKIKVSGAFLLHRESTVSYRKISPLFLKTVRRTVRKILRTMSLPSSRDLLTGERYNFCQPKSVALKSIHELLNEPFFSDTLLIVWGNPVL